MQQQVVSLRDIESDPRLSGKGIAVIDSIEALATRMAAEVAVGGEILSQMPAPQEMVMPQTGACVCVRVCVICMHACCVYTVAHTIHIYVCTHIYVTSIYTCILYMHIS